MEEIKEKHVNFYKMLAGVGHKHGVISEHGFLTTTAHIRGYDAAWATLRHLDTTEQARAEWKRLKAAGGGEDVDIVIKAIEDYGMDLQGRFKGFPHE